jgi:hypothetical protein
MLTDSVVPTVSGESLEVNPCLSFRGGQMQKHSETTNQFRLKASLRTLLLGLHILLKGHINIQRLYRNFPISFNYVVAELTLDSRCCANIPYQHYVTVVPHYFPIGQ